jgi:hypothetical protein
MIQTFTGYYLFESHLCPAVDINLFKLVTMVRSIEIFFSFQCQGVVQKTNSSLLGMA